ncbi:MAG: hypothetical protein E7403_06800 [Ruminococcaceae bacterium]|nr:hypothetical protein [Oscillospiraceae bacterium]
MKLSAGIHEFSRINGSLDEYINEEFHFEKMTEMETNEIVEVPISDVESVVKEQKNGITAQEAEQLCFKVLGEKDADTGFPFSFGVSGAVKKDGKLYYVIRASWLVNNSHMSYIGDFFASADGKELYNGLVQSGEYEMLDKIWCE